MRVIGMRSPVRRRHLRDAATICTETITLSNGQVLNRCELDAGHLEQGEKHKAGCSRWGKPKLPDPEPVDPAVQREREELAAAIAPHQAAEYARRRRRSQRYKGGEHP